MKEEKFLSTHSSTWRELEFYCSTINHGGIHKLSAYEIKSFLNLFKTVSHHLAYAKTHYTDSQTIHYLNNLVSQCNTYVYTSTKPNVASFFTSFFTHYAEILKKHRNYILFSFATFLIGALISFFMVFFYPNTASLFLESDLIDSIAANGSSNSAGDWNYPLMSSYIMTNNILVSLKAFIFGITVGIGTLYILFYNGIMLGSLTALFYLYGDPLRYWSLILPHGIIELTAIFIAGAAGFILAKSFLLPGNLSRTHSLVAGAKEALNLMSGVVVFLVIAGLIEGFFTPLSISVISKLLFALLTAVLLAIYFIIPYLEQSPPHQ